jgi:hypothetical protein
MLEVCSDFQKRKLRKFPRTRRLTEKYFRKFGRLKKFRKFPKLRRFPKIQVMEILETSEITRFFEVSELSEAWFPKFPKSP